MRLNSTDRIELERFFSRNKCWYGLGCIITKLEETQLTFIALSVFISNLLRIQKQILLAFIWLSIYTVILNINDEEMFGQ